MSENSFTLPHEKEVEVKRKPFSSCKNVADSVKSAMKRLELLKKVINNKILTMQLYYSMVFLSKWRLEAQQQKEQQTVITLQRYAKGYLARKQVRIMRQYQSAKIAIYSQITNIFSIVSQYKERICVYDSMSALTHSANVSNFLYMIIESLNIIWDY